jgi:hypothetical protein
MQLDLEPDEVAILKESLASYLSDLRAEIGKTEDYETRRELHQREAVLQKVIARLGQR